MSDYVDVHTMHIKAAGAAQRTVHDRERLLRFADGHMPHGLVRCTTQEIEEFLANATWERETRATYWGHLAGFFAHMASGADPYLTINPMADMKRPRVPEGVPNPVTNEELTLALERSDAKWRLRIVLAAYAGLRVAEIAAMQRQRISRSTIHVVDGKGGRDAYIPTRPEVWELVEPMPPGPLMRKRNGGPATGAWLSVMARAHFNSIGLPHVHMHRLRHWTATALTAQGVDVRTTQTIMRHRSLATTARYIQISERQRREAITALPSLTPSPLQDAA